MDGGHSFGLEQLNAVIGKWERVREDLKADRLLAVRAANPRVAPAEETANWCVGRGNDAWEAFLEHNRAMSRFVNVYLAELTGTRDACLQRERDTTKDFDSR